METELASIKPYLEVGARRRQRWETRMRDDLVQEGLIAAWQALVDGESARLASWRGGKVMDRLLGEGHREKWTGHSHTRGVRDPMRRAGLTLSLDAVPDRARSEDRAPDVDVWVAVSRLPLQHKEIVYRKFWMQETWAEIGTAIGMSLTGVHNVWTRTITPCLKIALGDLCNTPTGIDDSVSFSGKVSSAADAREGPSGDSFPLAPPRGYRASVVSGPA